MRRGKEVVEEGEVKETVEEIITIIVIKSVMQLTPKKKWKKMQNIED